MPDLRWVPADLPGVLDLVDEDGDPRGYVMPCRGEYFVGYVRRPGRRKHQRRSAFLDNSGVRLTEAAARAWVEDAVRTGGAE